MTKLFIFISGLFIAINGYCQRSDGAVLINVNGYNGSLQNGSWSPDNQKLMCTNWEGGYNEFPANIFIIDLSDNSFISLTTDGLSNVNMPGLTWSSVLNRVVFSSERTGDGEYVFTADPEGAQGNVQQVTSWSDRMCWEPGFSPDGEWVVYEAHYYDSIEENGIVEIYKIDGSEGPYLLTASTDDCRQPSWSPAGDKILYQKKTGSTWNIWTMNTDGTNKQNVTKNDPGDKTDASFSPDGNWIIYSTDNGVLDFANIFIKNLNTGEKIRVTEYSGYDGAPSWSSDNVIVFESTPGDPDGSSGSTLWKINSPIILAVEYTKPFRATLYPNPTEDIIVLPNEFENSYYQVFSTDGKLCKAGKITENSIDLTGLKKGLFIVKVITERLKKQYFVRVIKND